MEHICDHDLERYHLGMVKDEAELAAIEEHLLWCHSCVDRAEESADYVDTDPDGNHLGKFRFGMKIPASDKKVLNCTAANSGRVSAEAKQGDEDDDVH
jgi:hypothetical protein